MKVTVKENTKRCLSPAALAICFLVLLEPAIFKQSEAVIDLVYNILQVAVASFVIYKYAVHQKINAFMVLIALYYLILLATTAINDGEIKKIAVQAAAFVSICLLIDMAICNQAKATVRTLRVILEVYLFINVASIILFPEGMYTSNLFEKYYFLGYKNQMINFILPALCLSLFDHVTYRKKSVSSALRVIAVLMVSLASALLVDSGASTIIVLAMACFVLARKALSPKIFNANSYLVLNILIFFAIVVFEMQYLLSDVIQALGRDLTLTGRVYIWEKTRYLIQENWLLGYGVESYADRVFQYNSLGYSFYDRYAGLHAHDRYLETLFRGGILLLVVYLSILVLSARQMYRNRSNSGVAILAFSIFLYLTGMITEFYEYSPLFFGLLLLGYRSSSLSASAIEPAKDPNSDLS